jgi:hypothetical protein
MIMEKEVERKISLIHAGIGAIFGVVTPFIINRELTFLSVLIIGLIVSYPLRIISMKIFNLSDEDFKIKEWIAKGFLIFFMVWIIVWTFLFNLL